MPNMIKPEMDELRNKAELQKDCFIAMTDAQNTSGKIFLPCEFLTCWAPEMYTAPSCYLGKELKKHSPSIRRVYSYQQYINLCYVNNNDKPMTFKTYLDNIYCYVSYHISSYNPQTKGWS